MGHLTRVPLENMALGILIVTSGSPEKSTCTRICGTLFVSSREPKLEYIFLCSCPEIRIIQVFQPGRRSYNVYRLIFSGLHQHSVVEFLKSYRGIAYIENGRSFDSLALLALIGYSRQ